MKKGFLFTMLLIIVNLTCSAQVEFEKGYFVDNQGKRVDCLINNSDWDDTPSNFKYKLSEDSDVFSVSFGSIKELTISDYSKFVSRVVDIDMSSDKLESLDNSGKPIYVRKRVFLKQILSGKANLYVYSNNDLVRFFFSVGDAEIKPLVYKRYFQDENHVVKNNFYLHQLMYYMKCDTYNPRSIKRVEYNQKDLTNYFKLYNKDSCFVYKKIVVGDKKPFFNIYVTGGVTSNDFTVDATLRLIQGHIDYSDGCSGVGYRFGLEFEHIMSFNRNKWAVYIAPTYRILTIDDITNQNKNKYTRIDIYDRNIEFPFGLRHYMFLNKKSKLFIDAGCVIPLSADLFGVAGDGENNHMLETNFEWFVGLGYRYNDLFSAKFGYSQSYGSLVLGKNLYYKKKYKNKILGLTVSFKVL